jgi:DNA-binding HxlR family transcriptional regulator
LQESTLESEFSRTHKNFQAKWLNIIFLNCPVEASLGLLGKKWTFIILRDIGGYGIDRFSRLVKSLPGIPPKVLATRLKELEEERFIDRHVEKSDPPKIIKWSLTEKGLDAIRIGMMLAVFGSKWHADRVFNDKRPRKAREIFNEEGMALLTRDFWAG